MPTKDTLNHIVYAGIKAELLRGDFLPAERLDGRTLELRYNTSSTPVRMALSRLAGERLIEQNAMDGFHAPLITESSLGDLYTANRETLRTCLVLARFNGSSPDDHRLPKDLDPTDIVATTEAVFMSMALASLNTEFIAAVRNYNERLRVVRRFKGGIIPNRAAEIMQIREAWHVRDYRVTASSLRQYHRVRLSAARKIAATIMQRTRDTG